MIPAAAFSPTIVLILAIAGICVSVLSIAEKHVPAITSFCKFFGEGCQKTMDFTLFRIPIGWWGLVFYLVLLFLIFTLPSLVFPAVMAGVGFEITFLYILMAIKAFCIFCMLNAIVVLGLFLCTFSPELFWPAAAIALFFFITSNFLISRENVESMDPSADTHPADKPAARVNGETITARELEIPLRQTIYEQKLELYRLKRNHLEKMILERLAEKGEKKARSTGTMDKEARKELFESLKEKYHIEILLKKPTLPFLDVDISGSPSLGPDNAPVIIVEFSDYFCPYCREMHPMKEYARSVFGDRIRWVFKDFPLDMHKRAREAAEAARCAHGQGKFWEYQGLLFSHDKEPDEGILDEFAGELGLDEQQFRRCRNSRAYRDQVGKDIRDGLSAGVAVTPTFLINDRQVSGGMSKDEFMAIIENELKKTGALTGIK